MKVNIKNIQYYFLTCDTNGNRKKHIMDIFKGYNITEVNPVLGIHRNQSGPTGYVRMIDLALRNQNRSLGFQPFILIEDDCSFYRELPETIVSDGIYLLFISIYPIVPIFLVVSVGNTPAPHFQPMFCSVFIFKNVVEFASVLINDNAFPVNALVLLYTSCKKMPLELS